MVQAWRLEYYGFMLLALKAAVKRWFQQRHFYAGVCIPLFFVFIMLLGGFKNFVIILHEARTTATITAVHSNGRGRSSLDYRYEVGGRAYTGKGGPDHPAFTPPFAPGDTFEIRYSTWLPFFSTAQNPLTIFGQFAVGSLVLFWVDYMAVRQRKRQESNTPQ